MKCLSCGTDVFRSTDRMCPSCAAKLISKVIINAKADKPKENSQAQQITPTSPAITQAIHTPAVPQEDTYTGVVTAPKPQTPLSPNPIIPPVSPTLSATTPDPTYHSRHLLKGSTIAIMLTLLLILVALGGLFGAYPYIEAKPYVTHLREKLPYAETVIKQTITSIQESSEFEIESLQNNNQIGETKTIARVISDRYEVGTYPNGYFPSDVYGQVAGSSVGVTLAYDMAIQQYEEMTFASATLVEEAKEAQEELETIQEHSSNLWIADEISDQLRAMTIKGETMLSELDAIITYQRFNVTVTKKMADINAGLEIAFLSEDFALIADTLDSSIKELNRLQMEFNSLQKPSGSEAIIKDAQDAFTITIELFSQMKDAYNELDYSKLVDAANRFLVNAAQFATGSEDNLRQYWQRLPLGSLYEEWDSERKTLIDMVAKVEENRIFQLASNF